MSLTTAQLNADWDSIVADLVETAIVEAATTDAHQSGGSQSFSVVRGQRRTGEELRDVGWRLNYRMTVMVKVTGGPTLAVDDIIALAVAGEHRILNIEEGPSRTYLKLDLGSKWANG